jgi:ABC transporter with metal-binding/Fe-S-binding domain ATP-binding protein
MIKNRKEKLKLAILFSGGKDSCLALNYALKYEKVVCLIAIESENKSSYMFHTPNIFLVRKQAEAMNLPLVIEKTKGEKEQELKDLERAIKLAIKEYNIQGIITGALASVYQASRIQKICNKLEIECFNPLWQKDQIELLEEIVNQDFEVIIDGVFAEGLIDFIGKKIDEEFIEAIKKIEKLYNINPAGVGGELECFVLNAPFFKKKISIGEFDIINDNKGGVTLNIKEINLIKKKNER